MGKRRTRSSVPHREDTDTTKTCADCLTRKDHSEYSTGEHNSDGLRFICKPCQSAHTKANRAKRIRIYGRDYVLARERGDHKGGNVNA